MRTEILRFLPAPTPGVLLKKVSALFLLALVAWDTRAQTTAFTYQGRLNDGTGPANGSYDLTFALFDAAGGGNQVGGGLTNAATAVSGGLFTVNLDFGNQFPGADRWLEITVRTNSGGAFATLAPRQKLTAAPYATRAASAGTAATALTAGSASSVAAANISGPIQFNQLAGPVLTNNQSGVSLNGIFDGNGAGLTNLQLGSLAAITNVTVVAWGLNAYLPPNLTNVTSLSGGTYHSLALINDGTVVVWGANFLGQTNVPPGVTNIMAVAAGGVFSLALKHDGTIIAWGDNGYGETNVPSGLSNVMAVSAGDAHSLALKSNGTVVAWGDNEFGQTNVPANLVHVTAVAAGGFHSLALKDDGTIAAWGLTNSGQATVPPGLINASGVAAGYSHSLALRSDGTVIAWGDNTYGQATVPAGLSNVVAVAAGEYYSLALRSDGTVIGWGSLPVPEGLSGVLALAQGGLASYAMAIQQLTTTAATSVNGIITAIFQGDGGLLTNLNAGTLSSGTIDPARLPPTLAMLNVNNSFFGNNSFSGTIALNDVDLHLRTLSDTNNGIGFYGPASTKPFNNFLLAGPVLYGNTGGALGTSTGSGQTIALMWNTLGRVGIGTNNPQGQLHVVGFKGAVGAAGTPVMLAGGEGGTNLAAAGGSGAAIVIQGGAGGGLGVGGTGGNILLTPGAGGAPSGQSGRVGIGTASPASALDVNGTVTAANFSGNGGGLTNLPAGSLAGSVPSATLTSVPAGNLTGNVPAATLTSVPAGNLTGSVPASTLTSIPAGNLTGSIADARLSSNVALLSSNHTFSASNIFSGVTVVTNVNNTLAGNGAGITSLTAANLTGSVPSGTLTSVPAGNLTGAIADGRLSPNVPLLSANQTFAGTNLFNAYVGIGTNNPQATLDVAGSFRINQGTKFTRVQDGIFTAGASTTNTLVVTNTFPIAFSTTPTVLATAMSQSGTDFPDTFCVTVRRVTTTNVVVNIVRVDQNGLWGQSLRIAYHAWE
jgi:alpha-tubulin suppressor-like RCC1 family protein